VRLYASINIFNSFASHPVPRNNHSINRTIICRDAIVSLLYKAVCRDEIGACYCKTVMAVGHYDDVDDNLLETGLRTEFGWECFGRQ